MTKYQNLWEKDPHRAKEMQVKLDGCMAMWHCHALPLFHSALWPGQDAKVCAASNAATSKGPRIAKTEQRPGPRQVSTGMLHAHAVPT